MKKTLTPILAASLLFSCGPKTRIIHETVEETVVEADPNDILAKRSKDEITITYTSAPTFESRRALRKGDTIKLQGRYQVLKFKPVTIPKELIPGEKQDFATFHFMQETKGFRNAKPIFLADITKELFLSRLSDTLKTYGVLRQAGMTDFRISDSSFHMEVAIGIPMTRKAQVFEVSVNMRGKVTVLK